jgi:hypothetical protein
MAIFIYPGGASKVSFTRDVHLGFARIGGGMDGCFQTDDPGLCDVIRQSSMYQSGAITELVEELLVPPSPPQQAPPSPPPPVLAIHVLRRMAKEKGMTGYRNKTRLELQEILGL